MTRPPLGPASHRWIGWTLAGLCAARAALSFVPSMWAWSLNVQRFLDPLVGGLLWLVLALSLVPGLASRVVAGLERITPTFDRPAMWVALLAAAGAASMIVLLGDRTWFTGDFMFRQTLGGAGSYERLFPQGMPLDRLLYDTWPRAWFGDGAEINGYTRLVGALDAALLAVLAVAFGRVVASSWWVRLMASAALFWGGHLVLYTGFGKASGELTVVTAGVAVAALHVVRTGKGLMWPALAFALGLGLHRAGILLLPAVIVAWWLAMRRPAASRPSMVANLGCGAIVAVALLGFGAKLIGVVRAFDAPLHLAGGRPSVALFNGLQPLDLLNLLIVLAPLAVVLPLLAGRARWREPETRVLVTLAASFVPIALFVQPQQGTVRDWDILASAGVAVSTLTAWWLAAALAHDRTPRWLAVAVAAAAIVPSLQWLIVNAHPARGLSRVEALATEAPVRPAAEISRIWDFLGSRYTRLGDRGSAAAAYREVAARSPHRRTLLQLAIAETNAGEDAAAVRTYRALLEIDRDDPLAWIGLAGAAIQAGDSLEAERAGERLVGFSQDPRAMAAIRRHLEHFPEVWPLRKLPQSVEAPPAQH